MRVHKIKTHQQKQAQNLSTDTIPPGEYQKKWRRPNGCKTHVETEREKTKTNTLPCGDIVCFAGEGENVYDSTKSLYCCDRQTIIITHSVC